MLFAQAAVQASHDSIALFSHPSDADKQVATALRQMGIRNGDCVAYMGYALTDHAWAYMAGTRIIAEIPSEDIGMFWAADSTQRDEVLKWLRSTGARALITRSVLNGSINTRWQRMPDTDYYVLRLAVVPTDIEISTR